MAHSGICARKQLPLGLDSSSKATEVYSGESNHGVVRSRNSRWTPCRRHPAGGHACRADRPSAALPGPALRRRRVGGSAAIGSCEKSVAPARFPHTIRLFPGEAVPPRPALLPRGPRPGVPRALPQRPGSTPPGSILRTDGMGRCPGQDFLFFFPMLGKRFRTAALTFFCSAGVPCCATRASALRAWALSGIGYLRLPGRANDFLFSFFRSFVL